MYYIYLILAPLSSLAIALLMRVFEEKGLDRKVVIASNYIVAFLLGYFLSNQCYIPRMAYLLGVVIGLLFFINFVFLSKTIKTLGVASTVTFSRLSLAIPVGFSIFLWGEKPLLVEIVALIVITAVILLWEDKIGKISSGLFTIFLLFGLLDTALKFFKVNFRYIDDSAFLVVIYLSAGVWSWGYILFKRIKPVPKDILAGLLLGVPNYFSSYFLLKAMKQIPGFVVFPFNNIFLIIASAITGVILFNETLTRRRILLIILGIAAVGALAS